MTVCIVALMALVTGVSCTAPHPIAYGNYYSQGDYIIESKHADGWRSGHYLLTIDSTNAFVLKEASRMAGNRYTVCQGRLQRQGRNTYRLDKVKVDYPYAVLGNPLYNDDNIRLTVQDDGTIILQNAKNKGRWKTVMKPLPQDSVPQEFDFTKYGYVN